MTMADGLWLIREIWPFLAAAGTIGGACGISAWTARPMKPVERAGVGVVGLALVAAAVAAALRVVRDRAGLALDIGVALGTAFLLGCALGWALRRLLLRRSSDDWS